ncbi:TniB family NTP-binding protein [Caulobacter endophyticus]|nr:TniB family NTP-binding protein [Caulobacter endophyticus]
MSGAPIGLDPDLPLSGIMEEDWSAASNEAVADLLALFNTIFVAYPLHSEFHSRCDFLMKLGRSTQGAPQKGLRVLAPTGSGKTRAAEEFIRMVTERRQSGDEEFPVVLVPLDRATTSRKLFSSILQYFGDEFTISATEAVLKERAYKFLRRFKTLLLIIDEVQHLTSAGSGGDVTDSLKRLLDDGVVPVVFLGTIEGKSLFTRNLQLSGRLLSPCDYRELSSQSATDRGLLSRFAEELDLAIVHKGLMRRPAGLSHPWISGCLHEVSAGVIGRISRIMYVALEIARRRHADCIEVFDLALAVDRWALEQGFTARNPFRSTSPDR